MAALVNSCYFTATAGGTTDWTPSAAVTGYMTPSAAGAVSGKVYKYRAESASLTEWEVGEGVWNGTTLARTTVFQNSAGTTAKINFTGAPNVGIVSGKEDVLAIDEANSFTTGQKTQARSNIAAFGTGDALGSAQVAVKSDQDTATNTTLAVTPGRQQYHPSAAKAWVFSVLSGGTPGLTASYNVSSITDAGVGLFTVNFTTSFSSANYTFAGMARRAATNDGMWLSPRQSTAQTSSACPLTSVNNAVAAEDPASWSAAFFGDQ